MFIPTPEQRKIVRAVSNPDSIHNAIYGTVGSGKTSVSLRVAMDRLFLNHEDRGFTILAKRLALLKDPIMRELRNWARERGLNPNLIKREFALPSRQGLPNEITLAPYGVGGTQMKENIQGGNKVGIFIDEGLNIDWETVSEVLRRVRLQGFFTCWTLNPDGPPFHPLKRKFIDQISKFQDSDGEEGLNGTVVHVGRNQHPGISDVYYDMLEKTMTRLEKVRYLDGEFAGNTLSVYGDAWRDYPRGNILEHSTLTVDGAVLFAGVDYAPAGTNAAVLVAATKYGNFFVVDEWRHYHPEDGEMSDKEKARAMYDKFRKYGPIKNWWLDKANGHGVRLALQEFHGQNAYLTDEQPDTEILQIKVGCSRVRRMFELEKLFVHPRCTFVQEELGMYSHDEDDPDGNPIKEHDHFMDALRYALISVPASSVVAATEEELERLAA